MTGIRENVWHGTWEDLWPGNCKVCWSDGAGDAAASVIRMSLRRRRGTGGWRRERRRKWGKLKGGEN